MAVTKIRTQDADDDKLAEKCKEEVLSHSSMHLCADSKSRNSIQTKCNDSSKPHWTTHQDCNKVQPPEGTIATVVDVRKNEAAIRIFETQSNDYIDGVGTEEARKLVIVP